MRRSSRRRLRSVRYSPDSDEELGKALLHIMSSKRSRSSAVGEEGGEKTYRLAGPDAPQVIWLAEAPPGEERDIVIISPGPDDDAWQDALPHMSKHTAYLLPDNVTDSDQEQIAQLEDAVDRNTFECSIHWNRIIVSDHTHAEIRRAAQRKRNEWRSREETVTEENE